MSLCLTDLRVWSRDTVAEFIQMYKAHPCLWKVKSDDYKNKYVKAAAYKELARFCKNHGFKEATRDFVVRKIQSLRGSFRKELKKAREYQKEGKVYSSSLWYFNLLMFTKDQETGADDEQQSGDETLQSDGENDEAVEEKLSTMTVNFSQYTNDSSSPPPSPPQKKPKTTEYCIQPEFFDVGQNTSKLKDITEFELIGMNVSKKLARMDPIQAIYAESIINNVIRKGLLKKLNEQTDLCDNMCSKKISSSSNLL